MKIKAEKLACSLLLLLITIVQLENLFSGYAKLLALAPIFLFLSAAILRSLKSPRRYLAINRSSLSFFYILFVFITAAALIRAALYNHERAEWAVYFFSLTIALTLIVIHISSAMRSQANAELLIKSICLSPAIYVVVNLTLFFLGFTKDWTESLIADYGSGRAIILSYAGIEVDRTRFLLANGVNSFSIMAGIAFIVGYYGYRSSYLNQRFAIICMLSGATSLLLIDSRGGILAVLLTLIINDLIVKKNASRARAALVLITVYPLAIPIIISTIVYSLGWDQFGRGDSDLSSLNSRGLIWGLAGQQLDKFEFIHAVGYGSFGHHAAGLTSSLGSYFSNKAFVESISLHNAFLQMIFDVGYIGTIVFLVLALKCAKSLAKSNLSTGAKSTSIGTLIFIFLISGTEVALGPYSEAFMFTVAFLGIIANMRATPSSPLLNRPLNIQTHETSPSGRRSTN